MDGDFINVVCNHYFLVDHSSNHELLAFEFLYGKLGFGRDILPLEVCMAHAALYIPNLPAEINFMIGEYVYFRSTAENAIQQQNLQSLLEEFQQRKPKLFAYYLEKIFHRLKSPHYPTLQYQAFVAGIKTLNETHLSPLMKLSSSDHRQLRELLQIRQVVLYLCSCNRKGEVILQYTDDHFKDDKEVVLAAVKCNSKNFHYASSRLKSDEDVLLAKKYSVRWEKLFYDEYDELFPWEETFLLY